MTRHGPWQDLDEILDEFDTPVVRIMEHVVSFRVADFLLAAVFLMVSIVCFCAPAPPPIVQRLVNRSGQPGPPSASGTRLRAARCCLGQGCQGVPSFAACRVAAMDKDPADIAVQALDSLSHIYANAA